MHEEFLPNESEVPFAEVPTPASTHPGYRVALPTDE
jgi:hypothetical protein